jgi:hypothetical protein
MAECIGSTLKGTAGMTISPKRNDQPNSPPVTPPGPSNNEAAGALGGFCFERAVSVCGTAATAIMFLSVCPGRN